jgi:hypothetical protein
MPHTRFGNNLFQIFAAIQHAQEYNFEVKFVSTSYLDKKSKHIFSFIEQQTPPHNIFTFTNNYHTYLLPPTSESFVWESLSQNINYINKLDKQYILSVLCLNPEYHNKTILYVRGDDYLSLQLYTKRTIKYYKNAIEALNVNYEDVICCTDDIEYAKTLLKDLPITYSHGTWIEDFLLGIGAKNLIITNSTFSVWAAYLSNAENVIRPKEYYDNNFPCELWDNKWIICND